MKKEINGHVVETKEEEENGLKLRHYGILFSMIHKIDLIEIINGILPLAKQAKTTMGERAVTYLINSLSSADHRLCSQAGLLAEKPIELFFDRDLKADDFNEYSFGRLLDAIEEYGVTRFFSKVALEVRRKLGLTGKTFHIDTTNISLYGKYYEKYKIEESINPQEESPEIFDMSKHEPSKGSVPCPGHAKSKRHELNQTTFLLAMTEEGFPIHLESHSGNASDKVIIHEAARRINNIFSKQENTAENNSEKESTRIMIADSAMHDKCTRENDGMVWITRVPETHGVARRLLENNDDFFIWLTINDDYKIHVINTDYRGTRQRWVVVHSRQAYERECKTLERNIEKDFEKAEKQSFYLSNRKFNSRREAENKVKEICKTLRFHKISYSTEEMSCNLKNKKRYRILTAIEKNDLKINKLKNRKGRFILTTNHLDREGLQDKDILFKYKAQSKVEGAFKVIKNNLFKLSSIYFKNPRRISAYKAIVGLSLMIHNLVERELRIALAAENETIPDQANKPIDNPTMRLVFNVFRRVQVTFSETKETLEKALIKLNSIQIKIIRLFGGKAIDIYCLSS